jgi:hypothetical protein
MKTASEVAEELWKELKVIPLLRHKEVKNLHIEAIAQVLTAFAESHCVNYHADAQRLIAWLNDPKRKPAVTAFTAGQDRQVAFAAEHFAEEQAMEAVKNAGIIETGFLKEVQKARRQARAEALGELEKWIQSDAQCESKDCSHNDMAECILTYLRALKGKP